MNYKCKFNFKNSGMTKTFTKEVKMMTKKK